jgi:hypothetical protein
VKLATAANLADVGAAGIKIMLQTGVAGDQKLAAKPGDIVAPSVLSISSGAADGRVTVNTATGRPVRTTLAAATTDQWIVGICDKQGNTVIDPRRAGELHALFTADREYELVHNGTNWEARRKIEFDIRSWGALCDGSTNDVAAWRQCFTDIPQNCTLRVPCGNTIVDIGTGAPLELADDIEGGQKRGVLILGAHSNERINGFNGSTITFKCTEPHTTTGTYVSRGTSGSQKHWRLRGFTNLGSHHIGRRCWVWGLRNSVLNAGEWYVSGVYNDAGDVVTSGGTTVSLYNPHISSPFDDSSASGSISAHIDMVGFIFAGRAIEIVRCEIFAGISTRLGCLIDVVNPGGTSASLVTAVKHKNCLFGCYGFGLNSITRVNVNWAPAYVPKPGNVYYQQSAHDGTAFVTRVANTVAEGNGNCDTLEMSSCYFPAGGGGWYTHVQHGSSSGQSVQCKINDGCIFFGTGSCYLQPARFSALAACDFNNEVLLSPGDCFALELTSLSRNMTIEKPYIEAVGGFLYVSSTGFSDISIWSPHVVPAYPHSSGTVILHTGLGNLSLHGGIIGTTNTSVTTGFSSVRLGSVSGKCAEFGAFGTHFDGKFDSSPPAGPARHLGNSIYGIWAFDGTEEWDLEPGDTVSDPLQATSSGVAPAKVWQVVASGPTYTDITAFAANATNADTQPFPTSEVVGDYCVVTAPFRFQQLTIDYANGTAGIGGTMAIEYWNGSAWTALTGVVDGTSGFTAAPADGYTIRCTKLPTNWAASVINGATSGYSWRFKVTGTYSTNPVLDQIFVWHGRTFWIDSTILTAAANDTGDLIVDNVFPLVDFGLPEVYAMHMARITKYISQRYGWPITSYVIGDQQAIWFASTNTGSTARLKTLAHSRSGKTDILASVFNLTPGSTAGGFDASECEADSGGHIANRNDGVPGGITTVRVTLSGCNRTTAVGSVEALPALNGKVYGTDIPSAGYESGEIRRRKTTVTVTSSGHWAAVSHGVTLTSGTFAAATTATINLSTALPPNTRLVACIVDVTAAVSAGTTATASVGKSGATTLGISAADLKTTGVKNSNANAGVSFGTAATQAIISLASDVNLSTWGDGTFSCELLYILMP